MKDIDKDNLQKARACIKEVKECIEKDRIKNGVDTRKLPFIISITNMKNRLLDVISEQEQRIKELENKLENKNKNYNCVVRGNTYHTFVKDGILKKVIEIINNFAEHLNGEKYIDLDCPTTEELIKQIEEL